MSHQICSKRHFWTTKRLTCNSCKIHSWWQCDNVTVCTCVEKRKCMLASKSAQKIACVCDVTEQLLSKDSNGQNISNVYPHLQRKTELKKCFSIKRKTADLIYDPRKSTVPGERPLSGQNLDYLHCLRGTITRVTNTKLLGTLCTLFESSPKKLFWMISRAFGLLFVINWTNGCKTTASSEREETRFEVRMTSTQPRQFIWFFCGCLLSERRAKT